MQFVFRVFLLKKTLNQVSEKTDVRDKRETKSARANVGARVKHKKKWKTRSRVRSAR